MPARCDREIIQTVKKADLDPRERTLALSQRREEQNEGDLGRRPDECWSAGCREKVFARGPAKGEVGRRQLQVA